MMAMFSSSFAYRFSPKLFRFLGRTYAPTLNGDYTFAPTGGLVTNNVYSPSLNRRSKYSPVIEIQDDTTFTPIYETSSDYSPRIKSNNDYNPFTSFDKNNFYEPYGSYDYEIKTDYSPTNINVRKPVVVIDDSPLKYLTAYNRYILGILGVLECESNRC